MWCLHHVRWGGVGRGVFSPRLIRAGVLAACWHPTCLQFGLAGLWLPSRPLPPPKGGWGVGWHPPSRLSIWHLFVMCVCIMCVDWGWAREILSQAISAGGAYSVLTPNPSAVWMVWPSTSLPLTSSPKGRPQMSDDPPPPHPPTICVWCDVFIMCIDVVGWGRLGALFPRSEQGVLTACWRPTCLLFGLVGLKLPSCWLLPPKEDQYVFPPPCVCFTHVCVMCIIYGRSARERPFPRLLRAGGAYSVSTPNLSAVQIGWPSSSFLIHRSPKGRQGMSDDLPPTHPPHLFVLCVLMGEWARERERETVSQADQSRGCLQCVDAQPVSNLDWLALSFLPAPWFPQREAGDVWPNITMLWTKLRFILIYGGVGLFPRSRGCLQPVNGQPVCSLMSVGVSTG